MGRGRRLQSKSFGAEVAVRVELLASREAVVWGVIFDVGFDPKWDYFKLRGEGFSRFTI